MRNKQGWLSDQILAFYFLYLEHEKYKSLTNRLRFISPQITQWLKLGSVEEARNFLVTLNALTKEFLFFAVNDGHGNTNGSHWSLLVYSRASNTFYNFDSLNDLNHHATHQLVRNLKTALGCPLADFIQHCNHQQLNTNDCGLHVLCNAENVIQQILYDEDLTKIAEIYEFDVVNKREEILAIINHFCC